MEENFDDILGLVREDPSSDSLEEFCTLVSKEYSMNSSFSTELAKILAKSGQALSANSHFDIASTGGPASLTTLIPPLFLSSSGLSVSKLGVPGRPAGGIDVMAQIPGFEYELSVKEISEILEESKFAHFNAGVNFTPLDAKIFKVRTLTNTKAIPSLVSASILAKKLSSGVSHVGLDLRVYPDGNFGTTRAKAMENAIFFKDVARRLNIEATVFITSVNEPPQDFVGRGEAILAIKKVLDGEWNQHITDCQNMAICIADKANKAKIANTNKNDLKKVFIAHINSQGGDFQGFLEKAHSTEKLHTNEVLAPENGFIRYDQRKIRDAIVDEQNTSKQAEEFCDPCGVIYRQPFGSFVREGQTLMTFRHQGSNPEKFKNKLDQAVHVGKTPENESIGVI
ncbi:MAG: hypothetical protein ACRBHB_15500 [Arenicella sp.]